MKFTSTLFALCAIVAPTALANPGLGYGGITPSIPLNNTSFSFGRNYAVLNLDMINGIYGSFNTTPQGQQLINSTVKWIDAVHQQNPIPLTIFTRIYFSTPLRPELGVGVPFGKVAAGFGNITESSFAGQLYPAFKPIEGKDIVIPKTRLYAGAGNGLEQFLSSSKIDTVILSGTRASAVIISTAIRLFDLNYNVYVIADNVIESAPDNGNYQAILQYILPKAFINVISLDQALGALSRSGPAIF